MESALIHVFDFDPPRQLLMEPGDFRRGLNDRIEDIAASGRLAQGVTASQLRNLPLHPIGDGRYNFKSGNSVIVDKNGQDLVVNFNLEPEEREPSRFRGTMGPAAKSRAIPPWEIQSAPARTE